MSGMYILYQSLCRGLYICYLFYSHKHLRDNIIVATFKVGKLSPNEVKQFVQDHSINWGNSQDSESLHPQMQINLR